MKDGPLLRLLRSLNKSETRKLKSQLKKSKPILGELLGKLGEKGLDYPQSQLDEKRIFESLFGLPHYNASKMRDLKTKLKERVEQYIVWAQLEENKALHYSILVRALRNRPSKAAFLSAVDNLDQELQQYQNGWEFHRLSFEKHYNLLDTPFTVKNIPNPTAAVDIRRSHELNYLIWMYYFEIDRISRRRHIEEALPVFNIPIPLRLPEGITLESQPLLLMLKLIYELLINPSDHTRFNAAFQKLQLLIDHFPAKEKIELTRYLINHCIQRYNSGDLSYLKGQIALYKWGQEKEVFVTDGYIDHTFLINAVITAAVNGELLFASNFLEKHKAYLSSGFKHDSIHFCEAFIHFHRQEYLQAIDKLALVRDKESYDFGVRRQSLLLRSYYCVYRSDGPYDYGDVEDRCHAFEAFFKRNTYATSPKRKKAYLKLKYFVEQMAWFRNLRDKKPKHFAERLQEELEDASCIAKKWITHEIALLSEE
jgi:hypothetical protein